MRTWCDGCLADPRNPARLLRHARPRGRCTHRRRGGGNRCRLAAAAIGGRGVAGVGSVLRRGVRQRVRGQLRDPAERGTAGDRGHGRAIRRTRHRPRRASPVDCSRSGRRQPCLPTRTGSSMRWPLAVCRWCWSRTSIALTSRPPSTTAGWLASSTRSSPVPTFAAYKPRPEPFAAGLDRLGRHLDLARPLDPCRGGSPHRRLAIERCGRRAERWDPSVAPRSVPPFARRADLEAGRGIGLGRRVDRLDAVIPLLG